MTTPTRYSAVAIVLHWAIAFAILFNIPLGLWMHSHAEHNDISEAVFRAFQLHKSIGLTVLALSLVRLGWRLANPPPRLPEHMPAWERAVAKATHWAFYVLTIALPLTGWLYVSAGWSAHTDQPLNVPTRYFGLFHVPDLFGLSHADAATRSSTAHLSLSTHGLLGWAMLGLATLHVAAALKHQFFDRDAVLAHMVPGLRAPGAQPEAAGANPARSAILGLGLGATALLGAIALYTVFTYPKAPLPAQTTSTFETADTGAHTPPPASSPPTQSPTAETTPPTPAPAAASTWTVNSSASSIGFSFVYRDPENGDTTFNGRFTRWHANIRFDANDLPHSSAVVVIETGSATDGVEIHDRGLPAPEWFDASAHPTAEFRTTSIRRRGDGYEAAGQLTIKGHMKTVTLPFTLAIDGNHASMRGTLAIERGDFDIGVHSDANDMISQTVNISIRVDATRGS
jgi:cytochrome b561